MPGLLATRESGEREGPLPPEAAERAVPTRLRLPGPAGLLEAWREPGAGEPAAWPEWLAR